MKRGSYSDPEKVESNYEVPVEPPPPEDPVPPDGEETPKKVEDPDEEVYGQRLVMKHPDPNSTLRARFGIRDAEGNPVGQDIMLEPGSSTTYVLQKGQKVVCELEG